MEKISADQFITRLASPTTTVLNVFDEPNLSHPSYQPLNESLHNANVYATRAANSLVSAGIRVITPVALGVTGSGVVVFAYGTSDVRLPFAVASATLAGVVAGAVIGAAGIVIDLAKAVVYTGLAVGASVVGGVQTLNHALRT